MCELFESDVILYGGQTTESRRIYCQSFESDVILYGGQTIRYTKTTD